MRRRSFLIWGDEDLAPALRRMSALGESRHRPDLSQCLLMTHSGRLMHHPRSPFYFGGVYQIGDV
jgi:hypothetical protein